MPLYCVVNERTTSRYGLLTVHLFELRIQTYSLNCPPAAAAAREDKWQLEVYRRAS